MFPFLSLPAELRIQVYNYAIDWNDALWVQRKYKNHSSTKEYIIGEECANVRPLWTNTLQKHMSPTPNSILRTPTILLLNRQITVEAQDVLKKKPLLINGPEKIKPTLHNYYAIQEAAHREFQQPGIFEFISHNTLSVVPHVKLRFTLAGAEQVSSAWLLLLTDLKSCWNDSQQTMRRKIEIDATAEDEYALSSSKDFGGSWWALWTLLLSSLTRNVEIVYRVQSAENQRWIFDGAEFAPVQNGQTGEVRIEYGESKSKRIYELK